MAADMPLSAPIAEIDRSASVAERRWMWLPILGWWISGQMWARRAEPIGRSIDRQLKARACPSPMQWGEDEHTQRVGLTICRVAAREFGWSNDFFLPADPAEVVFWAHEDGLDFECFVLALEEELGISISMEEAYRWPHLSLGQVVWILRNRTGLPKV